MRHITLAALAAALLMTAVACTGSRPAPSATGPTGWTVAPGIPASTREPDARGPSGSVGVPVVTSTPAPTSTPPVVSATPGAPASTPTPTPTAPGNDRRIVEAPIDSLAIRIAESAPPQYFLDVTSGLPSGCAQFYRTDVSRAGTVITVKVLNTMPAATNQACTMIYGYKEHHLALGSDFTRGVTYTVNVNDKQTSFTAR